MAPPTDTLSAAATAQDELRRYLADRLGAGVLIQGEPHSFHHRAATHLLPGVTIVPERSFPRLAQRLDDDAGQLGLMAIENSVAGALLTNYLLIEEHNLRVLDEVYLRISHAVLGVPGAQLDSLRTVESHPMALRQCRAFLRERPTLRPVEAYDTAGAAAEVARAGDTTRGAVGPVWCAAPLGLEVLAAAVEDNPHNWTRFVLLAKAPERAERLGVGEKTSVAFSLDHTAGSLAEVLTLLAALECSLTKIQSLPIVGRPWEYRFFCDFEHERCAGPPPALRALSAHTHDLTYLGTYAGGQHHQP